MSRTTRGANGRDVPDETLMARYADGDAKAFEALFERYEPRAYVFFLRRTGSPERAEDLYQELFLRIHRACDRYDSGQPFSPWFFQIANRLLVDDYRRAFRNQEVPLEERDPRTPGLGSEDVVADREHAALLLGALSPDERYVLLSAKVEGIGYPELAQHLGKSVDAVKKMASRAMRRLRGSAFADEPVRSVAG
jgi:RNA polymerase sigma-70 factor (ECF subfamily)